MARAQQRSARSQQEPARTREHQTTGAKGESSTTRPNLRSVSQLTRSVSVPVPAEIFGAILDELIDDKQFLLRWRLLSKEIGVVADSRAFRCLSVWCTGPIGARRKGFLDNVVNNPRLSAYVKEITWKEETGVVDDDAMEAFLLSVKALTKFPNVNTLRFWFPTSWNEPYDDDDSEMSPSRHLQTRVFNELAELYCKSNTSEVRPQAALDLLEIRGLITMPNESLRSDAFKELVQPIPNLVISLVTSDAEDFNHSDENYSAFLDTDLTGIINAARNLRSLTLESDIITFYDWEKVETLPNLHHLELQNFVFGYLFSPEGFILRHRSTIRRLDLIRCWLDTDPHTQFGGPAEARVWKDVFQTFQMELVELVDMMFSPLPGVESDDDDDYATVDGYVWLDTEGGYKNSFSEESPCRRTGEDDRRAYESLQRAIQNRRGKQRSM